MRKEQLTGSQLGTDLPSEGLVGQLGNYGLFSLERRSRQMPRSTTPGGAYEGSPMEGTRTLPHEAVLYLQAGPCAFWDSEEVGKKPFGRCGSPQA